jgi:hypothetical protein
MGRRPNFAKEVADLLARRLKPERLPNPVAIRATRELYEKAKRGEIIELVAVGRDADNTVCHVVAPRRGMTTVHSSLIGVLAVLLQRICRQWDDPNDPESED